MAYLQPDKEGKVYLPAILTAKEKGEKLVCLTAYDYPTARIVDEAGVDMILVGDSMGNVIHGYGNTIPVTLDEIVSACIAVKRGTERAMAAENKARRQLVQQAERLSRAEQLQAENLRLRALLELRPALQVT